MHCVVDIGRARRVAMTTVNAAPSSIEKPRDGECRVSLFPSCRIILYPYVQRPIVIAAPKENSELCLLETIVVLCGWLTTVCQNPNWYLASRANIICAPDAVDSRERTDGVRDIVRTMSEGCNRSGHAGIEEVSLDALGTTGPSLDRTHTCRKEYRCSVLLS